MDIVSPAINLTPENARVTGVECASFKPGSRVLVRWHGEIHPATYVKHHLDGSHEIEWDGGQYANERLNSDEVMHADGTKPVSVDAGKHPFPVTHLPYILGKHLVQHYGTHVTGVTMKPRSEWKYHTHKINRSSLDQLEKHLKSSFGYYLHGKPEKTETHHVSVYDNKHGGHYQLHRSHTQGVDDFVIAGGHMAGGEREKSETAATRPGSKIQVEWDGWHPASYVADRGGGRHEIKWDAPGYANEVVHERYIRGLHKTPVGDQHSDSMSHISDTAEMSRELQRRFGATPIKADRYAANRRGHSLNTAGYRNLHYHLAKHWQKAAVHKVGDHVIHQFHNGHGAVLNLMHHEKGNKHGVVAMNMHSHVAAAETARPGSAVHAPPPTVMKRIRGSGEAESYEVYHNRQLIGTVHKADTGWHAMHNGKEAGVHGDLKVAGRVLRNLHLHSGQAVPAAASDEIGRASPSNGTLDALVSGRSALRKTGFSSEMPQSTIVDRDTGQRIPRGKSGDMFHSGVHKDEVHTALTGAGFKPDDSGHWNYTHASGTRIQTSRNGDGMVTHVHFHTPAAATATDESEHKPGDPVEAKWNDRWYKGTYGHKNKNGTHHVHWTGQWKGYHETVKDVRKTPQGKATQRVLAPASGNVRSQ